jgi:hypothetical protein
MAWVALKPATGRSNANAQRLYFAFRPRVQWIHSDASLDLDLDPQRASALSGFYPGLG